MIGAKLSDQRNSRNFFFFFEIQGMQAVSNLPISAWLTAAARRGFPAVKICQRKPSADW